MFRFFESLIDPFRAHDETAPPARLFGFYLRYCLQVWPMLTALAVGLRRAGAITVGEVAVGVGLAIRAATNIIRIYHV